MLILSILFAVYSGAVYRFSDMSGGKALPSVQAEAGRKLWQENNCQSCHQIYGLGGYAGPDLTNAASVKGADYMHSFISSGTDRMPNFHLTPPEVDQLVAFLSWVDRSGSSRVPDSDVLWNGSYQITAR